MFASKSRATALQVRRLAATIATLTAASLALAAGAQAASFTVNDPTDAALANPAGTTCASTNGGSCTLRAAVQAADNSGGSSSISLPSGDFKLAIAAATEAGSTENPGKGDLDVLKGVSLTITGAGASTTTINANHIDRAFAVHSGAALTLSGVTIEGGAQPDTSPSDNSIEPAYGGAIYNNGSLLIENSTLTHNSASSGGGAVFSGTEASATSITNSTVAQNTCDSYGGAIYVESGTLTLNGDQITHNSGDSEGGAIYDYEYKRTAGAITIDNSTVSANAADSDGGAIYDEYTGPLTISASQVSNNTTDDSDGGAIYSDSSGTLTVNGSTFDNDSAGDSEGGALVLYSSDLSVSNSTFAGDEGDEGGAIYLEGSSSTASEKITASTFTGNHALDDDGGAVYDDEGNLEVTQSTFAENDSSYYGGALYYDSGDALNLTNDTFDGNQGIYGGAIYFDTSASTGSIDLLNDTIAHNTAYDGGGIAYPYYANSIENTIVADNAGGALGSEEGGGDCYYPADYSTYKADSGGNIDSDGSCFSDTVAGDQTSVNPLLGMLADNGGPTATDALLSGSPAIGKAIAAACPAIDQRGVSRSSGACDVGAYQTAPADLGVTLSGPATAAQGGTITYTVTVTNHGPAPAAGVTLTDALPGGTSLYSVSASQGACAGTTTLTCSLGVLSNGASATVNLTAIANATGVQTDKASVSGNESDPNPANNSASVSTLVKVFVAAPSPSKPQAKTGKASEITKSSLLMSGIVNPEGFATNWRFALGTRKKHLKRLTTFESAGSGTTPLGVLAFVKGLKPGTRYFVELLAVNSHGNVHGKIISFKTKGKAPKKHKGKHKK